MTHVTILASPRPDCADHDTNADLVWRDEADCARTAAGLAASLKQGLAQGGSAIIELHGTLGAGKTTLTRHLLRALGVEGRIKSPSYAVVEPYDLPDHTVQHFDFYRFNDPQEWEDAGFRDLFAEPGLKIVEWPDKAEGLLPQPDLRVHIDLVSDTERRVRFQALSALGTTAAAQAHASSLAPATTTGSPAHD
jgi:tRNA threonylcarbamoyladenosine biosynthesis protein TsaE